MGRYANGKDFATIPSRAPSGFQVSPDCLCPSRGMVDFPALRVWFFRVLIERHSAQILLKGARNTFQDRAIARSLRLLRQSRFCRRAFEQPRDSKQVVAEGLLPIAF